MRYPHTKGMTQYLCDSKAKTSYVDLLVAEGLDRERTEEGIANADAKSDAKTDAKTDSESATETTKGGSRSKKRVIRMKASYSK